MNAKTKNGQQDSSTAIIFAAWEMLGQAESLLHSVTDEQYVATVPAAFDGSIGAHLRHCIDHFTCFLAGTAESRINYDHRERDSLLENDRSLSLARVRAMRDSVERLNPTVLTRSINVTSLILPGGAFAQEAASSFGRELMYVVTHTLHHFALIRVMANLLGAELPRDFGIASSTLEHHEAVAVQAGRRDIAEV